MPPTPEIALRVALPVPLPRSFDYLPPAGSRPGPAWVGRRIRVPFGRGTQELVGIVVEIVPIDGELKQAIACLDESPVLSGELFASLRWAAGYYHAPLGEVLALVTNDLKSAATRIASLYKERWQIEMFFKWIKQNLKIKKFFGQNANAIRIQLLTALITYLLILLFRASTHAKQTLRQIVDEIKTGPFHRPQVEASRWRRRRAQQALQNAFQPELFR